MGKEAENNVLRTPHEDDYDSSFGTYVWNSKTGQFFGRTGTSWAKLIIFYIIFYLALAAFFGLYYFLFDLTLSPDRPKWILGESRIGTNPGLGYRPMPNPENNAESTLIWYQRDSPEDAKFWYKQLENYVLEIENTRDTEGLVNCNYNGTKATKNRRCRLDLSTLDPKGCSKSNHFGYTAGDPCILLKLNKIFGWEPEGFGIEDGKYNPNLLIEELDDRVKNDDMPVDLKNHILKELKTYSKSEIVGFLSTIWISCGGEGVSDRESIDGIAYHPQPGIPGYYFPYHNQKGYQSPFMFVQLMRPLNGVLINVECKAWAKNIFHDRVNRLGSVHFEVMVD